VIVYSAPSSMHRHPATIGRLDQLPNGN